MSLTGLREMVVLARGNVGGAVVVVCVCEFVLPKKILCVMGKRETWKFIIQTLVAILSAIATSFGVASCCCEVIRF